MNLTLQKSIDAADIEWESWTVGFHGTVVDDRGAAGVAHVQNRAPALHSIHYLPESYEVEVADKRVPVDTFADAFRPLIRGRIVLEATTLGFVEILLCCRAMLCMGIDTFDITYVEPKAYRSPRRRHLLHRRDFELSSEVPGYRAIPGHAMLLEDRIPAKGVFFLGYEESRLRRAFEDLQMIRPSRTAVAFGVPAFKPGWEMDAMANNIGVIREQNVRGGVYFCGAENPTAVVELLDEIHGGLEPKERLFIAPIGTKPHGIGVALFVSRHPDVRIIYDHPRRTEGRSKELGHWHLFSVLDFTAGN